MSLQEKIVLDWKFALKNKDPKKDALSMIITELKNRAIKDNVAVGEGRTVADDVAITVLQKMAKQRQEAIDAYQSAKREDLAKKEKLELSVIECYLPTPLSDDELRIIVKDSVARIGASSSKDIGKVMAQAIKAVQGRADGKRIQALAQEILGEH